MAMKIRSKKFTKNIAKMERFVKKTLPNASLKEMKDVTPRGKTSNAKRKTILKKKKDSFILEGNYPYSGVIDRGEYPNPPKKGTGKTRMGYSTQAMDGIIDPTMKFIKKEVNKFIRRFG
jgi:hypothetical protein